MKQMTLGELEVIFFIFVGLLIAANPYLAVKVYPKNQNVWQDCWATPMARLRLLFGHLQTPPCSRQTVVAEQIKAPSVY